MTNQTSNDALQKAIQDYLNKITLPPQPNPNKSKHVIIGFMFITLAVSITACIFYAVSDNKIALKNNCLSENYKHEQEPQINQQYTDYTEQQAPIKKKFYKISPPASPFSHDYEAPPVTSVKNAKLSLKDRQKINNMMKHDTIDSILAENHIKTTINKGKYE